MVRPKQPDHEHRVRNHELEPQRQPQHLPTASAGLRRFVVRRNFPSPHQIVKRCLQSFEPADGQAFTPKPQALANFGNANSSSSQRASEGSKMRSESSSQRPLSMRGTERLSDRQSSASTARSFLTKPRTNRRKPIACDNVNQQNHLCISFDNSLLKRVNSKTTACGSFPASMVELRATTGTGTMSHNDTVHTNMHSAYARGDMNQRTRA